MGSLIDQSCFLVLLPAHIVVESPVVARVTPGTFTVTFGEVGGQVVHQGERGSCLLEPLLQLLLFLLNFLYRIAFLDPVPDSFLSLQIIDSLLLIKLNPLNFVFKFGPNIAIDTFRILLENHSIMDHLFLLITGFAQFACHVLCVKKANFIFFLAVGLVTVIQLFQLQTHVAFHIEHFPPKLSFMALVTLMLKFDSCHCIFQSFPLIITLLVFEVFHIVIGNILILENLIKINSLLMLQSPVKQLFLQCINLVFNGGARLPNLFVVDDFDGWHCVLQHLVESLVHVDRVLVHVYFHEHFDALQFVKVF